MADFYVFNGDADGLCALQQMRLFRPGGAATLVTGVKRDVQLLRRTDACAGDRVVVFDISLEANRAPLLDLLEKGVSIAYFDHHYAGAMPVHPGFEPHIDTSKDVCTSILVDRFCNARYTSWAIAAAFGDNLARVARGMAQAANVGPGRAATLERLGKYLNYNAYGEDIADLHFDPAYLAEMIRPFEDPIDFVENASIYSILEQGYRDDMERMRSLKPVWDSGGASVFMLPGEPWAKRAVGEFANKRIVDFPAKALAVLSPKASGGFSASVRIPIDCTKGADTFCLQFATGGGRPLAAGINHLPESDVDRFIHQFDAELGQT